MSLEFFVIGILLVFTLASNVFWALVTFNLMNRLMSKSFGDYVQGKKLAKSKPQTHQHTQDVVIDPEVERQAQELNTLFNMV